jgi:hypothetical protein
MTEKQSPPESTARENHAEKTTAPETTTPAQDSGWKKEDLALYRNLHNPTRGTIAEFELPNYEQSDISKSFRDKLGFTATAVKDGTRRAFDAATVKEPIRDAAVDAERKKLSDIADTKLTNPEQREKFKADMATFEQRAQATKMSPEEVAKTYKEISRILDTTQSTKWSLTEDQRVMLGQQVMSQAANPYSIDQGAHNTCNVTAVEVRTYALHPSNAAKMMADVAMTQSYAVNEPRPKGTTIHLNSESLQPDDESKVNPPKDGDRSYATQLFNVTATNIVHKHDRDGKVYVNDPDGSKEVLVNQGTRGKVGEEPDLDDGQIVRAYHLINGTKGKEKDILIDRAGTESGDYAGVTSIKTEKELADKLAEAKAKGQLPMIIGVNSNVEPFWSDSGHGSAGGSSGGHVVNVTDYQPGPPSRIQIDNQWGSASDRTGDRAVTTRELFIAMHDDKDAPKLLAQDAEAARKAGKPNFFIELELLRLNHFNTVGEMNKSSQYSPAKILTQYKDYTTALEQQIRTTADRWDQQKKDGTFDQKKADLERGKIGDLIDDPNLPPSGKLRLLKVCQDKGLIDKEGYTGDVATIVRDMTKLKDAEKGKTKAEHNQYDYKKQEYKESMPVLQTLLRGMSPEDRKQVISGVVDDKDRALDSKFEFLRTIHDTGVLSRDDFNKIAKQVYNEFKEKEDSGEYKTKNQLKKRDKIIKAGSKLMVELTMAEQEALTK